MSKPNFPVVIKAGGSTVKIFHSAVRIKKPSTETQNGESEFQKYESYIVEHYEGSRRSRERRKDYKSALARANEIKAKLLNQDVESLRLTGQDRRIFLAVLDNLRACGVSPEHATKEYADALKTLQPFQLSLPVAVQNYADALKRLDGVALSTAVDFYEKHGRKLVTARTVPSIVDELVAAKQADRKGDYHVRDLRNRLGRFAKAFPGRILDVSSKQIDEWLRNLRSESQHLKKKKIVKEIVGKTRNNYRNAIVQLFNFARDMGYLPNDLKTAAEPTQRVKEVHSENEIFTPAEMEKLLSSAPAHLVPSMAIKAFCGVRTEEIAKVEWEMIRFKQNCIILPARITKLGQRRTVELKPNLKAWLGPFKSCKGVICAQWSKPQSIFHAWERYAAKLGIQIGGNKFRNSFISYRLAETRNIQLVALESGNSPAVIQRDYLELATPEDAAKWFEIFPSAEKSEDLATHARQLLESTPSRL